MVKLHTNHGVITLELDAAKAPKTVENFLQYVRDGFFDGTIFHRVIDGFMIQGGGFDARHEAKTHPRRDRERGRQRPEERHLHHRHGAHQQSHSATAQFFINVADNGFLDYHRAHAAGLGLRVFGKVVEGMDVVDKIKKVKTGNRAGHQDVPQEDVIIDQG